MESTAEVTELAGADLDGAPPCEMLSQWRWSKRLRQCGRKSTHRLLSRCTVHGEKRSFLCGWHARMVRLGAAACARCDFRSPVKYVGES